jgi:hypothetical protein
MDWVNGGRESLTIDIPSSLSEDERVVARRFADWINENVNRAVAAYANQPDAMDGRVVNTDTARLLSRDYREDPIRWTDAVHEPASALVKEVFQRRLNSDDLSKDRPGREMGLVAFLAGGPGSGKTYATRNAHGAGVEQAHTIYDTTLASYESAQRKVQAALDAGKIVLIQYVHCPIRIAIRRVYERALRTGRIVTIPVTVDCHLGARHTFLKLQQTHHAQVEVGFRILDNSGGTVDVGTNADEIGLINIPSRQDALTESLEVLRNEHEKYRKRSFRFDPERVFDALRKRG